MHRDAFRSGILDKSSLAFLKNSPDLLVPIDVLISGYPGMCMYLKTFIEIRALLPFVSGLLLEDASE
jgi:hypothetical protein